MSTGAVDLPMTGVSDHLHNMTDDIEMDDESDSYDCKYMDDSLMTGIHQGEKMPLLPGSLYTRTEFTEHELEKAEV